LTIYVMYVILLIYDLILRSLDKHVDTMIREISNIRERLEKVLILVPANQADAVQQLRDDCKVLLSMVESLQELLPKELA